MRDKIKLAESPEPGKIREKPARDMGNLAGSRFHSRRFLSNLARFWRIFQFYLISHVRGTCQGKIVTFGCSGVPGVPWHPQILADQIILSQPGGIMST